MPRKGRKYLETCFFHIIVQGINKEHIFKKEQYMNRYEQLIKEKAEKCKIKLIAYCIMHNHTHILIYTDNITSMSEYMKSINTTYAKYYNFQEDRVGIVFRNRYVSEPIYEEKYLLRCIGYIHNNPVKAGITEMPSKYKFSTYNDYINCNGIITKETLQLIFGSSQNYLDTYLIIHNNSEKNEFEDYDRKIEYTFENINLEKIVNNQKKMEEVIIELAINRKIPIQKISKVLQINRFKISRIINKYK